MSYMQMPKIYNNKQNIVKYIASTKSSEKYLI